MLSALITTEHSYPAMLLAEQLVHQRFVHPGPLVTYSYITISVDYIFTHFAYHEIRVLAYYNCEFRNYPVPQCAGQSRYGVIYSNFWTLDKII